jgi:RNA polymerase sigma-70 factor (ECF subfamily)
MVMAVPGQLGAWMAAAQRGDHDAYRDLLEAVQPMIFGYLRKRIESEAAAEDVTQDVLLTMHRVRHTYDPERPFEPWLFAIARSRLIDHLRRRRRVSAMEVLTDTMPEMAATAAAETAGDAAFEILDRLPATQREAFAMLKLEGLTTEEAARRAGVSVSALKVRAHRAYKALRKALAADPDE